MDPVLQVISERRSIRRYEDRHLDNEVLTAVLEAARWAPSWANSQCWEIIVVRNQDLKADLTKQLSPKNPATLAVANAPVTLAVCGAENKSGFYKNEVVTKYGDWLMYDLGLLSQTICLAARAYGLGTVIVGLFNHDRVAEILGVPGGYQVPALIPMGYPDHAPSAPKRKELGEFVHYDRFRASAG